MALVAIAAVLMGAVAWGERIRARARSYRQMESFCAMMERSYRGEAAPGDRARSAYWSALRRKYEAAAETPWVIAGDDPPPPE